MSPTVMTAAESAPDVLGPIRAWRVWSAHETADGWRLSSIHYRQIWEPRTETQAWCYRSSEIGRVHRITHDRHHARRWDATAASTAPVTSHAPAST